MSMRMLIRSFNPADAPAIRAVLNQIVERGDAFLYDTPFTDASALDWVNAHTAAFVAVLAGDVVGGYVLRPKQPGRGGHVCNAAYMVGESARGRGIGYALGEHSIAEAKRLGFTAMQFNAVVSTNAHAVKLWKSLGFETVGTLPRAYRHRDGHFVDLLVMFRPL